MSFAVRPLTTGLQCFIRQCHLTRHFGAAVCQSKARIDGKVVIVTGANAGIGKETALELVKRGGKVYMACRSVERAQQAVDDIRKATGISDSQLPILLLDLSSLESVRNFARDFKQKEKKLDILINNAGIAWVPYSKTVDGFERTIGVNHLGPFLLTHLLIDRLVVSPGSRIVNVSSRAHERHKFDVDDLMMDRGYRSDVAYGRSKLANILFTRELARRLGSVTSVYALHPGVIDTELLRGLPFFKDSWIRPLFNLLIRPFLLNTQQGAQTSIYCAVDEKIASQTGKFYSNCVAREPSAEASNDDFAKKLWDVSIKLVNLHPSEIHPLLR